MSQFRVFLAGLAAVGLLVETWAFAKPASTDHQVCACHHHAAAASDSGDPVPLQRLAPCPACGGSGNGPFKCFQCGGTGRSGQFQCSFCNGRGWTKCTSCNGSGQK